VGSSVAVLAQDTGVRPVEPKQVLLRLPSILSAGEVIKPRMMPTRSSQIHANWPTAMGKDERQSTYGWADLHSTTTTATTGRRDEKRAAGGAGVGR